MRGPFSRAGEALEVVPGLIVTQHSGEGKANQYFLRGFNLDHGTDLAITVDGMPVNMRTHGHGQGYADINFLIPELIQSMNIRKGPYFADEGDFSSAGSRRDRLPQPAAEEHRASRPSAASAISARWRQARPRSAQGTLLAAFEASHLQRPVGRSRQRAQAQRRAALQPGHRRPTASR